MSDSRDGIMAFFVGVIIGGVVVGLSVRGIDKLAATPVVAASVASGDPGLILGLVSVLNAEHEGKKAAERNLDETRKEAGQLIGQLIGEVERLQKRPSTKPMNNSTALDFEPAPLELPELEKPKRP